MATEQAGFDRLQKLVSTTEFQQAMDAYADVAVDPVTFLNDRGIKISDDTTVTIELTGGGGHKHKCWKICVGRPPVEICYEHCTDG